MKKNFWLMALAAAGLTLSGCNDAGANDDGNADETGGAETTGGLVGGQETNGVEPTGGADDDGMMFFMETDMQNVSIQCDVWTQDCPDGEKCMPYANDGGSAWNATKCTEVMGEAQPGDPCTVIDNGVSGIDTCIKGALCWRPNEEGEGTCVEQCKGSEENATCTEAGTSCAVLNDGVLTICLPECDPLAPNCLPNEGCYPSSNDAFRCAPDSSGSENGGFGSPCMYANACDPGYVCYAAPFVPGCSETGSGYCCTPFCGLDEAEPCEEGAAEGQQCLSFFQDEEVPPGRENLGVCQIPAE